MDEDESKGIMTLNDFLSSDGGVKLIEELTRKHPTCIGVMYSSKKISDLPHMPRHLVGQETLAVDLIDNKGSEIPNETRYLAMSYPDEDYKKSIKTRL